MGLHRQRKKSKGDGVALRGGVFGVSSAQAIGDGARFAVADGAAIDLEDGREFAHRARGEALVGCMDFGEGHVALDHFDARIACEVNCDAARDAGQAGIRMGGYQRVVFGDEDVGGIGFGNISKNVEHDRVVNACDIGLDFGEDVVDQIVVMDFGVDAHGRVAAHRGGDQADALCGINRRFPFCEHDEAGAVLVEARTHAGGGFSPPSEGEPNMHSIAHGIGFERIEDRGFDRNAGGDVRKGHGFGRIAEPVEVRVELKNFAVVHAQAFPNRVAALNRAVKDRYFGVFPREQFTADIDEDVFVARVGQLDGHGITPL